MAQAVGNGTWRSGEAHDPRAHPHSHTVYGQYRREAIHEKGRKGESKKTRHIDFRKPAKLGPNKGGKKKKKKQNGEEETSSDEENDPAAQAHGKFLVVQEDRDYEPINPKVREGADQDQDPRSRPESEGVALYDPRIANEPAAADGAEWPAEDSFKPGEVRTKKKKGPRAGIEPASSEDSALMPTLCH